MKRIEFEEIIEKIAPNELAEEWDNCGWQIAPDPGKAIRRILVVLEVDDRVVEEAKKAGADLILTHHPLLFHAVSSVDAEADPACRQLISLLRSGIAVYSCHTSFDIAEGGNNDCLGEVLGFEDIVRADTHPYLRKGRLPEAASLADFADQAAKALGIPRQEIRVIGPLDAKVRTACWCTGAGASFLEDAFSLETDLFITGDVKYHDARWAQDMGLCVLDAGHWGTEKIFAENMAAQLKTCLAASGRDAEVLVSEADLDPFSCK